MNSVIDFIKDFSPASWGLGLWDILAIAGLMLAGAVLINWIVSFLPAATRNSVKRIIKQAFNIVFYALIVLMTLNSILTGDYGYLFILAVLLISSRVDYIFKLYDDFMDKKINKE